MLLDDEDLAYMRETQAETRPTAATLRRVTASVPDGMGGHQRQRSGSPEPIQVRVVRYNSVASGGDIPTDIAAQYKASDLVRLVTDLVAMGPGDLIVETEAGTTYQVVSDPNAGDWTTAQIVWAVAQ